MGAKTLLDAVAFLGAGTVPSGSRSRAISISSDVHPGEQWSVQTFWDGWTAGTAPGRKPVVMGRSDCTLAGVAAGALAVGQAFLAEQGDYRAGRTTQSLSLWMPELRQQAANDPGPHFHEVYLPTALWFVGLGNLGQAYLWSLALLPYQQPGQVVLFLQDDQRIAKENWGTSVLVQRGRYGMLKTRAAEEWATARGFQVRRIDRRLDERFRRFDAEPGIALGGLDSMPARRLLGDRGFEYIIDSGLGATAADYQRFRINVFGPAESPAAHFLGVEDSRSQVAQKLLELPSYEKLARSTGDGGCGAAILAETSVAVPFVSAVVGALAIAQSIRIASGQAHHRCVAGDIGDLRTVRAVPGLPPKRICVPSMLSSL